MYLDEYEANSIKLFSKCARNQAKKFSQKKTSFSGQRPRTSMTLVTPHEIKKKSVCTFDMAQSREQREKKYKRVMTPAVGQYNPRTQKKVKLTWDILKIYNNQTYRRKQQNMSNIEYVKDENQNENNIVSTVEENNGDFTTELSQNIISDPLRQTNINQKAQNLQEQGNDTINDSVKKHGYYANKKVRTQNSRYKTIRSQVDMSRMTGRQFQHHFQTQGPQSNLSVSRSIEFIKSKTSQNIDFNKQISRQKIEALSKPINVPSDYTYDVGIIKPKWSKVAGFGKSVGRDVTNKSANELTYSYVHYDYDRYVWGAKSNVYGNTKTHVIQFSKQTNRGKVNYKRR